MPSRVRSESALNVPLRTTTGPPLRDAHGKAPHALTAPRRSAIRTANAESRTEHDAVPVAVSHVETVPSFPRQRESILPAPMVPCDVLNGIPVTRFEL